MTAATPATRGGPLAGRRALADLAIMAALLIAWMVVGAVCHVRTQDLAGRILPFLRMAMLLGVGTLLLRRDAETWASVGLRRPRSLRRTAGLAVAGYFASYLVSAPLAYVLIRLAHLPARGSDMLVNPQGGIGEYLFWLIPVAWGLAAFGEEMLFRGFFFTRLMKLAPPGRTGVVVALVAQSLFFGSLHFAYGVGTAMVATVLGLVLGSVYLISGRNLWAGTILHGLIDTTSISVAYFVHLPKP